MATTLLDTLAVLPSGRMIKPLSIDELGAYLRTFYSTQAERDREARHRLRNELYRDGGVEEMWRLIDSVFVNVKVRERRKLWARWARYDNITKKVVNELSQVYQQPAMRRVSGDENNARYQLALAACDMQRTARRINRMLNLHRALVVGPRVTMTPGDDDSRTVSLQVVTPDNARLITHPNDCHKIVAIAHRLRAKTVGDARVPEQLRTDSRFVTNQPTWVVWSEEERFFMRDDWTIMSESFEAHDLGRIPFTFVTLDDPEDNSPWPGTAGEDLIAADMAAWFTAVNELKEVKSATRQQVFSGNLDAVQRQQAADTEEPLELPDDVVMSSQDMSMDISLFQKSRAGIKDDVGANYGLPSTIQRNQGVQSAEARNMMRIPLRELRLEQHSILRPFERDLAECMSIVFESDMQELAFTTEGWTMDFIDPQTPLTPKEELERFEHERRIGLENTIDYVMRRNPDMTEEQAREFIERNVEMELWRNRAMRPLQEVSGSMGADTPAGTTDPPAGTNGGNVIRPFGSRNGERSGA